ncbi:HDOD domain-containing protein [Desulfobulbus rhabdoformis]|uniref:EAL and HDOD domain-containing protein n=1 Tax=Desulfobulbus rhabdoformis TaxID=34032 RepID=UPI001962BC03|nr:HDOD domain-containing protein [Desulfobulbus rhabdoformis]MBM9614595.1 HDOD domain-containing protein [Desulfobulbus rhabdoformis]
MDVYIARQPIFDAHKKIFAYELLFRQSQGLQLGQLSGDRATTSLLSTAFLTEGIEKVAGNRPCFINFTQNLLLQEIAPTFPKNKIIIEILEDVEAIPEVVTACRRLSELGYILALDDFVYEKNLLPLIELTNIIKIDYRLSTTDEIERMLYRLSRFSIRFLAEKIETYEEFEHARKLGFHYFQGYFFAKPESLKITEIASNKISLINLLTEINKAEPTVDQLETIIETDVSISYKLLRYINSSFYHLLKEVDSIRQAIIYLGDQEIRRFVTLVIVSELAAEKPPELIRLSIIRARWCQLVAEDCKQVTDSGEFFLLGLFSLIDAILDKPMQQVLEMLPLSDSIKEALSSKEGPYSPFLLVLLTYEKGQTKECLCNLRKIKAAPAKVYDHYLEAVQFSSILS